MQIIVRELKDWSKEDFNVRVRTTPKLHFIGSKKTPY